MELFKYYLGHQVPQISVQLNMLWDVVGKQVYPWGPPLFKLQDILLKLWCQILQHTFRGLVGWCSFGSKGENNLSVSSLALILS